MKELSLIGIGTGHPDHITLAGIAAMRGVDCILLPRKGARERRLVHGSRATNLQRRRHRSRPICMKTPSGAPRRSLPDAAGVGPFSLFLSRRNRAQRRLDPWALVEPTLSKSVSRAFHTRLENCGEPRAHQRFGTARCTCRFAATPPRSACLARPALPLRTRSRPESP